MARTYFQTDSNADDGEQEACGTSVAGKTTGDREMNEAGPVGSGTMTVGESTGTHRHLIYIESGAGEPGETDWPGGIATVRINVTTANTNVSFISIRLCRVDSAGASLGQWGHLGHNPGELVTSGVHTFNVPVIQITGTSSSDQIYIVIGCMRETGHSEQQFTITMDQEIDTPIGNTLGFSLQRGILRGVHRGVLGGVK